jgi:hypothetical protein
MTGTAPPLRDEAWEADKAVCRGYIDQIVASCQSLGSSGYDRSMVARDLKAMVLKKVTERMGTTLTPVQQHFVRRYQDIMDELIRECVN